MASLITMAVPGACCAPVAARWNDGSGIDPFNGHHEGIGVAALVGDDSSRWVNGLEQRLGLGDVSLLGAGEAEGQRIAQRIGDHEDFGAPVAARATQ